MIILATIFIFFPLASPVSGHALAATVFQKESGGGLAGSAPASSVSSSISSSNQASSQSHTEPETSNPEKIQTLPVHSAKPTKVKKVKTQTAEKSASTKAADKPRIVRHGSAPEPALKFTPTLSQEQLAQQRQHTTELLTASDANLKSTTGRQLNPTQQDTVSKVRNYMQQATAADKSGDMQRAQALASKAKQLSDDLVSH